MYGIVCTHILIIKKMNKFICIIKMKHHENEMKFTEKINQNIFR